MDYDENRPIIKAAIQLCDELANLLGTATGAEEKSSFRNKTFSRRQKIGSWKSRVRKSEIIEKFPKNTIFSLEIAQSIVKSTSQLATTAKKINSKCNDFRLRSLIQVITKQHIEAAIRLIERYKIFSVNVHCFLCQQQLHISLTDIERSLERMISVCSKLYPNRRQLEELIVPASATQEALNNLRNIQIIKKGNGNRYCGFVEEPTDMTQSARILGEATAQVLLAIKEIVKEKPRWKGKSQLVEAAKALSETTSNMVKYAQLSIWYSELKHVLCSIENYDDMIRNQCTNDFLEILQFMAKESTKFSVDCFTLAKKIYSFKKTLIAYTFNNESLSLIYTAEKLVKSIKTANTTPLTSKLYKEILENSKEFLQDSKWVLDSFRNVISNFTVKT